MCCRPGHGFRCCVPSARPALCIKGTVRPSWYAEYALEHGLNALLQRDVTTEQLSLLFQESNTAYNREHPTESWPDDTARKLVETFRSAILKPCLPPRGRGMPRQFLRRGERMSITIPMFSGTIPYVTTEQMIEVDRAMVEDVRIELIQMM